MILRKIFFLLAVARIFCEDLNFEVLSDLTAKYEDLKYSQADNVVELENLKNLAFSVIVGVNQEAIQKVIDGKFEELEQPVGLSDVLSPLLFEISRILSRPRDLLKEEFKLSVINSYINRLERAKLTIVETLNTEISSSLKELLKLSLEKIDSQLNSLKASKTLSEARISDIKAPSSGGGVMNSIKLSLLNVLQAILTSVVFFIIIKQVKIFLEKLPVPVNPTASIIRRTLLVLLVVLNFIGAILAFTVILYMKGELFLLGLSILILVAIGLLSKRLITDFFSQAAILLNLGFVREGELIIFKDLPFRLKSLGFICLLDNPRLRHSLVRVPLSDLVDQRSFQPDSELDWYPTKEGDYIFFEGDTFPSKVIEQSIEFVRVQKPDLSIISASPKDFLNLKFRKVSDQFVVLVRFGISYRHISDVLSLTEKLKEVVQGVAAVDLEEQNVPDHQDIIFSTAFVDFGQSSLDILVSARCKLSQIEHFGLIRRCLIKGFLIFAVNNHIDIPFNSITVYKGN